MRLNSEKTEEISIHFFYTSFEIKILLRTGKFCNESAIHNFG